LERSLTSLVHPAPGTGTKQAISAPLFDKAADGQIMALGLVFSFSQTTHRLR
jgi:hypothetical protein